jgi:hypothetical protein
MLPLKIFIKIFNPCNPSYSGGRDQEDCSSKPAQSNSLQDPISKKPVTKIGLVEWLRMKVLSSSPSTTKKKKSKCSVTSNNRLNHN